MLWELLAADVERVEGIGAVGAVLKEVFLRFGLLLHRLVLSEAVSPTLHPGRLDGEDEVVVVHGIVGAERGGIVVEYDRMVRVRSVVRTEVGNQRRNLSLELDIERFEDIQAVAFRLTAHDPVDVGVVVHTDAERHHRRDVRVRAAVERRVERGKLRVGMDCI